MGMWGTRNERPMTLEQAKAVYAILVETCGAKENDPMGFVAHFTSREPATEWRFQGSLGFGGKFRYPGMTVDCYSEDETPERLEAIQAANERLRLLNQPAGTTPTERD
jgi:hypothetical protein